MNCEQSARDCTPCPHSRSSKRAKVLERELATKHRQCGPVSKWSRTCAPRSRRRAGIWRARRGDRIVRSSLSRGDEGINFARSACSPAKRDQQYHAQADRECGAVRLGLEEAHELGVDLDRQQVALNLPRDSQRLGHWCQPGGRRLRAAAQHCAVMVAGLPSGNFSNWN